ncbi:MAG: O-antigen ligase family protein [Pirellulales bacterium]
MTTDRKRATTARTAPADGGAKDAATALSFAVRMRPWLLFSLVALVVARPLLPSEGVSWIGDGQPFVMLTICLAVSVCAVALLEGGFARRFTLGDASVGALVLICMISALYNAQHGTPRNSINMLFEWLGMGLVYFLTRQLVRTPRETRALLAIMVALAVAMAGYGFYQVFIGFPSTRAAYAADPDAALRDAGQWFPPGSAERLHFESRLESSEPLATFALTNSLAGFLVPWFVMLLGVILALLMRESRGGAAAAGSGQESRAMLAARIAGLSACAAAIGGCLLLTKSRSAYVAAVLGVVLLPVFDSVARAALRKQRLMLAGAGLLVLLACVVAAILGGVDFAVLSEAGKSLGYRLEYWQATVSMIRRVPGLGVGPGNFQDFYTQFKLPRSSEEVRDPHNFLLEIWATAGSFAAVAMLQALGVLAWRTRRANDSPAPESETATRGAAAMSARGAAALAESADGAPSSVALELAGGATGFLLAFLIGPSVGLPFTLSQMAGGLLIGSAVIALVWPWIQQGRLSPRLLSLGVLVLAVHLLAAGGIGYPGVAGTFWILLALAFNETEAAGVVSAPAGPSAGSTAASSVLWGPGTKERAEPPRRRLAWAPAVGLLVMCGAGVACYWLAYGPVVNSHAAMMRASDPALSESARINFLVDAAAADPLSPEPWTALAEIELARLKRRENQQDPQAIDAFLKSVTKVVELRPYSAATWRQAGRWYSDLYTANRHQGTAEAAAVCLRHAIDLYPNLPELRGECALAMGAAGQFEAALRQLRTARRLEQMTPHADKKLSADMRRELARLETAIGSALRAKPEGKTEAKQSAAETPALNDKPAEGAPDKPENTPATNAPADGPPATPPANEPAAGQPGAPAAPRAAPPGEGTSAPMR